MGSSLPDQPLLFVLPAVASSSAWVGKLFWCFASSGIFTSHVWYHGIWYGRGALFLVSFLSLNLIGKEAF